MISPKNYGEKLSGVLVAVTALLMFALPAFGQTVSPSPSPSPTRERNEAASPITEGDEDPEKAAKPEPKNYFMPDLAEGVTTFNNKAFSLRIGFAVLADYTFVGQNAISRGQVGPQASIFDLRAGRLLINGQIKFKKPWSYTIGGDYDEHRNRGDRVFDVLDMSLTIPLWKKARITLGKQKEPFIFEMVAAASYLPQQERVLNPFFASRNIGIKYSDNFLKDRMSLSVGVYNDWFRSGVELRESGYQVSGRLTGLPIESEDHRTFLHLGLGIRYNGADKNQMRFRVRPETNAIDYYGDTGNFAATHAKQLSLEALYNKRSFSVLAEHTQAWVKAPASGNPTFNGSYVTVSYFLTDDTRFYDKRGGNIVPIAPKSRWGERIGGRPGSGRSESDTDSQISTGSTLRVVHSVF